MADSLTQADSPLSITSSVVGILTFLVAIVAAAYVRIAYLSNSDEEYFRVKTSLSWFKTESTWLSELVQAMGEADRTGLGPSAAQFRHTPEFHMYSFVMDDLVKLEQRLLEIVAETEDRAASGKTPRGEGRWPLVPRSWGLTRAKTSVAMAWLPVRTKALELVRQRDALTARVLFTQMSMLTSRIRDLEQQTDLRKTRSEENSKRLEEVINGQHRQIQHLERLIRQVSQGNIEGLADPVDKQYLGR